MTLDVAISTFKPEGLQKVEKMLLPPQEDVRYIISWQLHANAPVPESLKARDDVEIHRFDLKGLSNNRNNCIDHCRGDIILIADDDLEYHPDAFKSIIKTFEENPEIDLATFKIKFLNPKVYPESDCRLNIPLPKNYYVSSIEIAYRKGSLKDLRFWSELGIGNDLLGCGEEELFLTSAIKRGHEGRFIDKEIALHPQLTTGDKVSDSTFRGQGFIIGVLYPFSSFLRVPLKVYRTWRMQKVSFFKALREMSKGLFYSKTLWKKIPENCRW